MGVAQLSICSARYDMQRYQNAEGAASFGPLMDRIDIHLEVQHVPFEKLSAFDGSEPSSTIYARVGVSALYAIIGVHIEDCG